jgi:hypothetical protein
MGYLYRTVCCDFAFVFLVIQYFFSYVLVLVWTGSMREKDWRFRKRGTQCSSASPNSYHCRNDTRAASQAFERMRSYGDNMSSMMVPQGT